MTPDQNSDTPRFHQGQPKVQGLVERIPKRVQVCLLLIIVGVLGRAISRGSPSFRFLFGLTYNIGILLLVAWLAKLFVLPLVRKEQVVEQWSLLIENGQEKGSELLEHSHRLILDTRAPNITMEDKDIAPGVIRGVLGGTRPFLVISNDTNVNLRLYCMYLNVRDYGNNLQVSWYVVQTPSESEAIPRPRKGYRHRKMRLLGPPI